MLQCFFFLAIFSQNETDCEATQVRIGVAVRDILEFFLPRLDFMIRGAEGWLKFGVSDMDAGSMVWCPY